MLPHSTRTVAHISGCDAMDENTTQNRQNLFTKINNEFQLAIDFCNFAEVH